MIRCNKIIRSLQTVYNTEKRGKKPELIRVLKPYSTMWRKLRLCNLLAAAIISLCIERTETYIRSPPERQRGSLPKL